MPNNFCVKIAQGENRMASEQIGLSNIQRELLRLYGNNVSVETLREIKGILARYFADKASNAMDEVWEKQGVKPQDMIGWANEHNRAEDRP